MCSSSPRHEGLTEHGTAHDGLPGDDELDATAVATMAASSPTPSRSEDLRLRRKCTPQKCSPGATELEPSTWSGKPISSKALRWIHGA